MAQAKEFIESKEERYDSHPIRRAPTRILGSETRKLRNREVKLVKVQWGEDESNATWETEAKMRSLYPFLFEGMSLLSPLSLV